MAELADHQKVAWKEQKLMMGLRLFSSLALVELTAARERRIVAPPTMAINELADKRE